MGRVCKFRGWRRVNDIRNIGIYGCEEDNYPSLGMMWFFFWEKIPLNHWLAFWTVAHLPREIHEGTTVCDHLWSS